MLNPNPYLSAETAIPAELITKIFSYFNHADLGKASQATKLFNEVAQTPKFYRRFIRSYFPYLLETKANLVKTAPKELFKSEYLKWTCIAAKLDMDVEVLLAALRGKITIAQIASLNERGKNIVALLDAAGDFIRAKEKPTVSENNVALIRLLKRLLPGSFPGPLRSICSAEEDEYITLINACNVLCAKPVFSVDYLRILFRECLVAESAEGNSLFDKLKKCSDETLQELNAIINEVIINLIDLHDLPQAQQKLWAEFNPSKEAATQFKDYCVLYFGEDFITPLSKRVDISSRNASDGAAYIHKLCTNAVGEFASEILVKIDREMQLRSAMRKRAITHALNQHQARSLEEETPDPSQSMKKPRP